MRPSPEEGYWPDRHYTGVALPDANRTFTYVYNDRIDLIPRALLYFFATFLPEKDADRPANQYLAAIADKNGHPLEGGKLYSLTVPKDMPVKQFWALTVYDRATFAFIYTDSERTTLSSLDLAKMKANADGSVTLYVGPGASGWKRTGFRPAASAPCRCCASTVRRTPSTTRPSRCLISRKCSSRSMP